MQPDTSHLNLECKDDMVNFFEVLINMTGHQSIPPLLLTKVCWFIAIEYV